MLTLKFGKRLREAFEKPGGKELRAWINNATNAQYSALTYSGGAAWRQALLAAAPPDFQGANAQAFRDLVASYDDDGLHALMTNLGGHCFETLFEAFDHAAASDKRTCFLAYTVKGHGLNLAGHRDNHGLYLAPHQVRPRPRPPPSALPSAPAAARRTGPTALR